MEKKYNRRIVETKRNHGIKLAVIQSLDGFNKPKEGFPTFAIPGKGKAANQIACNVWELLKGKGVPVCYTHRSPQRCSAYVAHFCEQIPIQFVVRRLALGSFVQRHPEQEGERFEVPVIDIVPKEGKPTPFSLSDIQMNDMREVALKSFLIIEEEFKKSNVIVVDVHFEFGVDQWGKIVLMDPIDNKAWRLIGPCGRRLDGEYYQHIQKPSEEEMGSIKETYWKVVEITNGWHRK
ncbi:MAG: phosphoribosylaminoimidazolesuccinocarboxamide synthase [Planctomycetota bacterium]